MSASNRNQLLLALAVIIGVLWQLYLVDDDLGISWPQNVVRNWQQFGFFNLHGRLVDNPGGYLIATKPDVYKGMSPLCLWPAYGALNLFAWTGLGTLSFHLLLAMAVFWAIWELLGRDRFAFLVASAAMLSPGYDRWQKLLDPNAISVLLGLPYAAILVAWMKKPRLGAAQWGLLFLLTLLFISLNWTTAWVLGPLVLLLFGLPQVSRRSLILYVVLAGMASILFVGGSAVIKARGAADGGGHLSDFLRSYLWGNIGYGEGLTTGKAFGLLAFTNIVGLLMLWLVAAATLMLNRARAGRAALLGLAPVALAALDIVIMRNYFGHHPWMGAPVLLVGLVFSLVMLRGQLEQRAQPVAFKNPLPGGLPILTAACLVCFGYGLAVLLFFRANETNMLSLLRLLREHTDRLSPIVIVQQNDPALSQMASRFDELFDRHVVVVPDMAAANGVTGHPVILSTGPLDAWQPVAHNGGRDSVSALQNISAWFNKNIARRKAGDRLEFADAYYLYEPKP